MRIGLVLEYDGTNYAGWQSQENANTVQDELERALLAVTGEPSRVHGAGRTDAGVHALAQTAHFDTQSAIPPDRFSYALNSALPEDIRIRQSFLAQDDFHARHWAVGKRYRYLVRNTPQRPAVGRAYCMHVAQPLDERGMQKGAAFAFGTHDFASFCAANTQVKDTVRTIRALTVERRGDEIVFDVFGNGFLYNMVRILVGTLIEIGCGKRTPQSMKACIAAKDRNAAGPTAKAQGLFLTEVFYEREFKKRQKPDDTANKC